MTRIARAVIVRGRVQGVFFRQSAVGKAHDLDVGGWVRNCADGTVETHIEGEPVAVEAMLDWLRQGPAHAKVDAVEVTDLEPENSSQFEIRRG